jgi:PKHD-type hydroxylase
MISKYLKSSNLKENIKYPISDCELNYSDSDTWNLNEIHSNHNHYQVDDYFSDFEIDEIVNFCGKINKIPGSIGKQNSFEVSDYRTSMISWIPINKFTYSLYQKITRLILNVNESFYKYDLFSFERLQFTRYSSIDSGLYNKHLDCGTIRNGMDRKLSMVIQLSHPDEYTGGDLLLYPSSKPTIVERKKGRVVFFPSHTLHEVTPVTSGHRLSLVGWVSGPIMK